MNKSLLSKKGKVIKTWDRKEYPDWKSLSELKKIKLKPKPNVKPIAIVDRPRRYGGSYYLYDIKKSEPYHMTLEEKKEVRRKRRQRKEKYSCKKCGFYFGSQNYRAIETGLCDECYNLLEEELEKNKAKYMTFDSQYRKEDNVIALDVETTGLNSYSDEILELAIVDGCGNELFHEYFNPSKTTEWKNAEQIHGISPEDVADKPYINEYTDRIQNIISCAEIIVGYNISFDVGFLRNAGIHIEEKRICDIMKPFAFVYGEWNDHHKDYQWKSLSVCADYYKYSFIPHNALEDARATVYCYPLVKTDYEFKENLKNICSHKKGEKHEKKQKPSISINS